MAIIIEFVVVTLCAPFAKARRRRHQKRHHRAAVKIATTKTVG